MTAHSTFRGPWLVSIFMALVATSAFAQRPRIIAQPKKQIVPAGQYAEFEVSVADDGVRYEWYHDAIHEAPHIIGPQEGGDQRVLRLGPVAKVEDWIGHYFVIVRNEFGATRSWPARLVVVNPPEIIRQPASTVIVGGRSVRLAVAARFDGFPKTFQWYRNDTPIDGATRRVLWLRRVQPEDTGAFKVVIQNFGGTTTSETAIVQVE